jgi:hypothetical protein
LTGVDRPQQLSAIHVTTDYFRLFGLPIAQGRAFTADEERPNGEKSVILSDALWKKVVKGFALGIPWAEQKDRRQDPIAPIAGQSGASAPPALPCRALPMPH